jgi:NADH:ubiquinone oxidoreductase subunit C
MDIDTVVATFRQAWPDQEIESRAVPIADTFVALPPDCIHAAVALLVERFDVSHLSAITGQDIGNEIELLYHFWDGEGLTLRTSLPRGSPHIATLTDLIPGAAFYEREIKEMLGVVFDGHPNLHALLLPDDWEDEPPLRIQEEQL